MKWSMPKDLDAAAWRDHIYMDEFMKKIKGNFGKMFFKSLALGVCEDV